MQEHCCQQADIAVPHHTAWLSHLGAGEHICCLTWQPGHEEIDFGFETEIMAIFSPRVLICSSKLLAVLLYLGNTFPKLLLPISFKHSVFSDLLLQRSTRSTNQPWHKKLTWKITLKKVIWPNPKQTCLMSEQVQKHKSLGVFVKPK